jgi:hypoxanthine-DNA glycosylase
MIETHPFGIFTPPNARYLILGSFTGREAIRGSNNFDPAYDWFYGTKKNQFWPIVERVYGVILPSKQVKQELFTKIKIAMADIIFQCERRDGSNLDTNLINICYNTNAIGEILDKNPIEKIYFTSRFVEKKFNKEFENEIYRHPQIMLLYLPSPSPRYARMSIENKIKQYAELLPEFSLLV